MADTPDFSVLLTNNNVDASGMRQAMATAATVPVIPNEAGVTLRAQLAIMEAVEKKGSKLGEALDNAIRLGGPLEGTMLSGLLEATKEVLSANNGQVGSTVILPDRKGEYVYIIDTSQDTVVNAKLSVDAKTRATSIDTKESITAYAKNTPFLHTEQEELRRVTIDRAHGSLGQFNDLVQEMAAGLKVAPRGR